MTGILIISAAIIFLCGMAVGIAIGGREAKQVDVEPVEKPDPADWWKE